MKLLANAHISLAICRFLAEQGYDCIHAEQIAPGMPDDELLRLAVAEQRIILTADKDFGELVFRRLIPAEGVILLRLRAASEAERLALLAGHWPRVEAGAAGHFTVVANRLIRRTPLPEPPPHDAK